jgi:cell division septation protein DedD
MSLRRFENFEVRLGAPQAVTLCAALAFAIFIAYYLGLFAGRSLGIKTALAGTARSVVKIPVPRGLLEEEVANSSLKDEGLYASLKKEVIPKRLEEPSGPLEPMPLTERSRISPVTEEEELEEQRRIAVASSKVELETVPSLETDSRKREANQVRKSNESQTSSREVDSLVSPVQASAPQDEEFAVKQTLSISKKPTRALQNGWYSQVLASPDRQESDSLAERLRKSGFPVVLEEATVKGKQYYRVLVGPEGNKEMAERLVQQLEREPAVVSKPFIRIVR